MKNKIIIIYVLGIHLFLTVVLLKSDFIDRIKHRFGIYVPKKSIKVSNHFHQMLQFHKRMDGNVPEKAVIFIGDSITQGLCVSAIACPAVNYGIGGDTTIGVLKRLNCYNSIKRASAIVVAIGINDMKYLSNNEIIKNYQTIIDRLPSNIPVIISAILPIDEEIRSDCINWNKRIKALNMQLKKLASIKKNIFFVNIGPHLVDNAGNLDDIYHDGDGIHLNSKGNAILIKALKYAISNAQQTVFN